jgi:hypothetical protein
MIRTVRASLALVVLAALAAPAAADASPGWATPVSTLSGATSPAAPHVASDARGDTAVVWSDASGNVFESERPVGGSFSPATQISTAAGQALGSAGIDDSGLIYVFLVTGQGTTSSKPNVATKPIGGTSWTVTPLAGTSSSDPPQAPLVGAVTPSGKAIAVWYQGHTAGNEQSSFQYATKPAGSSTWTGKATVTNSGYQGNFSSPNSPVLAVDPAGDAALVFTRYDGNFINNIAWGTTLAAGASSWTSANPLWVNAFNDTLQGQPVVAIGSNGTATAAWVRNDHAGNAIVQFATKSLSASSWAQAPADDVAAGANDLSLRTGDASAPTVATEPDGTTTIAWNQDGTLMQATRPPGSTAWGAPTQLPNSLSLVTGVGLVPGADGSMVALWSGQDVGGHQTVSGARRAAGGSTFAALPHLPGTGNQNPAGASDDQGNIATAWVNSGAGGLEDQATGLVVGAPTIANVTFPSTATQGTPVTYGATVTDRWVTAAGTWNFGDNTTGPLTGSKTYTGTGTFNPVLTATDPFGNTATVTRSIAVSAPPPVPVTGGGVGGGAESGQLAPVASVSGLHESHRIWREGGHVATFAARHSSPVGTTFTFTLDQAATVTMSFTRPGTGRTVGSKCAAVNRRNRKHRKCTIVAGTITHAAHAGVNTVTFQGRVSPARRLAPGSYTLVVTAIGANGQTSTPQTIKFTIVKR